MRIQLKVAGIAGFIIVAILWVISAPQTLEGSTEFARVGDVEKGRDVFNAGGCASCHSAPKSEGDSRLLLTGGREFASPFGTFYAPNISPDPEFGIGNWSSLDLANAMIKGVSPDGQHYYPAFPYTSYSRVAIADIVDLHAFLQTLQHSTAERTKHDLPLPFQFRRGLGLWKLLYLNDEPIVPAPDDLSRGQYLVEALGHCGECHTPRSFFGGLNTNRWMAGAPVPESKGRVPNITPHGTGLGHWSIGDFTEYLDSGFTPDFDSAGGLMVEVIENTSKLSSEDRIAIATYLKSIPPIAKELP